VDYTRAYGWLLSIYGGWLSESVQTVEGMISAVLFEKLCCCCNEIFFYMYKTNLKTVVYYITREDSKFQLLCTQKLIKT